MVQTGAFARGYNDAGLDRRWGVWLPRLHMALLMTLPLATGGACYMMYQPTCTFGPRLQGSGDVQSIIPPASMPP